MATISSAGLVSIDRLFIEETIFQIETIPNSSHHNKDAFERSRARWRHRNHFLASYLKSLDLRVVGSTGQPLSDDERRDLTSLAYGYMKVTA